MATEVRYKIVHTDRTDASTQDLTQLYDIDTQEGIEASMDTFHFRLLLGTKPSRTLVLNDGIDIYIYYGNEAPTTPVINGIITEIKYEISVDGMVITVDGVNRVERLLFSPRPANFDNDYPYTGLQDSVARTGWGAIITHLIDKANDYKAKDDPTFITYDITSIPDLGDLQRDYWTDWKSVFEHLETLSTDEWTPNGQNYLFYLETDNKLWFKSKDTATYKTPSGTIDLDGSNVVNCTVVFGVFDVVNAILLNCGTDRDGGTVLAHYWNATSMGQYGAKFKYIKIDDIAESYKKNPDNISDPMPTIADERAGILADGISRAKEIVSILGDARYKIDIDMLGTTSYVRGRTYNITSSQISEIGTTNPKILRLINIIHRFSARSGWTTRLQLEQDEQTKKAEATQ